MPLQILLTAPYLIPMISLFFYPLRKRVSFGSVHYFLGRVEWLISFFRDTILAAVLLSAAVLSLIGLLRGWIAYFPPVIIFGPACFGLSIWCHYLRKLRIGEFIDLATTGAVKNPDQFFNLYFASFSGIPGHLPAGPFAAPSLPVNYSSGRRVRSLLPILCGIIYTGILARLIVRASKLRGRKCSIKLGEELSFVWGMKAIELASANFNVGGIENLEGISGRSIFVANHKSFLDFAVLPLAIGFANKRLKSIFRPRYMAARDHFYDNKFLYSVVGMGRAMEAMGTVFVDRRSKKEAATKAIDTAAEAIVKEGIDIVIFPQGTRALIRTAESGERMPAGYYTTVTLEEASSPRGHLKKGAAYLAFDASQALAPHSIPLNIIPVGIMGTEIAAPRGKIRIETGANISVTFGKPLTLRTSEVSSSRREAVLALHAKIDEMLKGVLNINTELKTRLLMDIRKMMDEDEMHKFIELIDAWRSDKDILFSVIDCIYSLPPRMRGSFIRRLSVLIEDTATPLDAILAFKKTVVREMIANK